MSTNKQKKFEAAVILNEYLSKGSDYHQALSEAREATYKLTNGNRFNDYDEFDNHLKKIKNECKVNGVTPLLTVDDILNSEAPAVIKNKYPRPPKRVCIRPLAQIGLETGLWFANLLFVIVLKYIDLNENDFLNSAVRNLINLYLFKPLLTFSSYFLAGISNRSIYAEQTFILRNVANTLYFLLAYLCFSKDMIEIYQFFGVMSPVIVFELVIYWVCVHPAEAKMEKVYFRMIRATITSVKENNDMWSTDDEEDADMHEDDMECGSGSSLSDLQVQNQRTMSLIQRRKSVSKNNTERMLGVDLVSGGGPFQVNFSKPYKPVFICFIDLVISISFALASFIYFLMKLDFDEGIQEIVNFMPLQIVLFSVLFFFKFFLNIFYLAIIC